MPIQLQLVAGIAASIAAYVLITTPIRCKHNQLIQEFNDLIQTARLLDQQVVYLADMLEKNQVPVTQFDAIVITHLFNEQ